MAANLVEFVIPDSPSRARSRSRERLLQDDERFARSLQDAEVARSLQAVVPRSLQAAERTITQGRLAPRQAEHTPSSVSAPDGPSSSSREEASARVVSISMACQMGCCGYSANESPAYKAAKPRIDHDYCCSLCRTSGGTRHGGWCQRRPHASTGSGGGSSSHGQQTLSDEQLARRLQAHERMLAAPSAARANAPRSGERMRLATQAALGTSTATVTHKITRGSSENESQQDGCRVCLEQFQDGDALRLLPCLHKFHTSCIDQWFKHSSACPICKHSIVES